MDSQYLTLLNTVVAAIETLRQSGVGVNVKVEQVNVVMPDSHSVIIIRDDVANVWEVNVT